MSVLLPSFACVTNNPFEAFWLMNSKAEALRSKSTRESHETFTTVYGHVHGRNGMFMVERHTVLTG